MIGNKWKYIFVISFFVLITAVIMATWGFPSIVKRNVKQSVQLKEGSMMYEKWRRLPMPISFKVYVFNVTNPEGVFEGDRPRLEEIGPYVYNEYRERIVSNDSEGDTITYTLKKSFEFNQLASGNLTEDDMLTVIHLPYMAALIAVQDLMPSMTPTINKGLEILFSNPEDPFLRVSARQLLFDGVFLNCEGNRSAALDLICAKLRSDASSNMRPADNQPGYMFSMFGSMNDTVTGPYEMDRGVRDISSLGHITSFEGRPNTSRVWRDDYCGMMNGSDGTIFPPLGDDPPERLYSFEPEICRSLYISAKEKTTLYNMAAQYYEMPESALASKSANPENKCFCKRDWSASHDGCLLMGVLNLNPCRKAPVIASQPHFYMASEELLDFFASGVNPDPEKHKTYVYIETTTGAVLQGARRMQFNIELRNIKDIPQVQNVPTGIFPLLWIEEYAELPESLVQELQSGLNLISYAQAAKWLFLLAAIIFFVTSAALVAKGSFKFWRHNSNSVSFVMRQDNIPISRKGP